MTATRKRKGIYTKADIEAILERLAPRSIYRDRVVNYKGIARDEPHEYYSEIAVAYILKHDPLARIARHTRASSYDAGHEIAMTVPRRSPMKREEEYLAKDLCSKFRNHFIDYQIPLNDKNVDNLGEIDLLLKDEDERIVIVELKREENEETLLRAILEIETYHRLLDCEKLLRDFKLTGRHVQKGIMIFENSQLYRDYLCIEKPAVRALLDKWGILIYLIDKEKLGRGEYPLHRIHGD